MNLKIFFISFLVFVSCFLLDLYIISSIGVAFSVYVFLLFTAKLGKELPIKEFFVLIASFQWIIGAKIAYNIGKVHYKYYMYVDELEYMSFVVPGVILFYVGLKLIKLDLSITDLRELVAKKREKALSIANILLVLGLSSFIISRSVRIPQLGFLFYLTNLLIYIAITHFMLLYPKRKNAILLMALSFMFLISLMSGFFHDFIISAVFLVFFYFSPKATFFSKVLLITIGFSTLYVIQLVKGEYRAIIWESKGNVSVVSAFVDVLEKEFTPGNQVITTINSTDNTQEQNTINTRLNQGWIISKIMHNVPRNQDFLRGSTITEAIEAAILPRFLFPNKKGAKAALDNFRNITGIDIKQGTSMGLSTIGEFYANFGAQGAWISIFFYGLFLSVVIRFIITVLGSNSPLILLWLILFLFQVIKAETELMKVVNHLFKSIIFFFSLRFVFKFMNITLVPFLSRSIGNEDTVKADLVNE